MVENRTKLSDMGQLSSVTYEAYGTAIKIGDTLAGGFSIEGGSYSLYDSYTVIDYTPSNLTDMQAILLERNDSGGNPTGEYVVAFRGTEPNSARDWISNGLTGLLNFNPQVLAGKAFVQEMMSKYSISADHLTLTGHSLGGIITQAVGADLYIEGCSFNPYGANLLSSLPPMPLNYFSVLGQVLDLFGLGDKNDPWIKENLLTVSYQDSGSLNGDILSNLLTGFSELIAGNDHLGGVLPILGDNVGLLDGHGIPGLNAAIKRYNEILAKFTEETTYSDLSTVYLLGGKNGFNSGNQVFDTLMIENMPDGSLSFGMLGYANEEGNLLSLSPSGIETLAQTDIAYRFALTRLNPFAVVGANYDSFNQDGELDILDPGTGNGQLSNNYLTDRAEMLANLIYCHIHDTTDVGGDGPPLLFTDIRTDGENISISPGTRASLYDQVRYPFGSRENDTLAGTANNGQGIGVDNSHTLSEAV